MARLPLSDGEPTRLRPQMVRRQRVRTAMAHPHLNGNQIEQHAGQHAGGPCKLLENREVIAALDAPQAHVQSGTLARRRQAQASRRVKDAAVVRFLTSPFHIPRWFERAEELLERQLDEDVEESPEERPRRPLRERAVSAAVAHPVLSSGILAFLVAWTGFRKVRDAAVLTGGALASFPRGGSSFFAELTAPVRTTLLGGGDAPSPILAALGSASWFAFGNGPRTQRWLLMVLLPTAIVLAYRAFRRRRLGPWPAIVASAAYGLSAALLWSFSEGRLPLLVLAAVLVFQGRRARTPTQVARSIEQVATLARVPSVELLKDFEAIRRLNQPSADLELLAAFESPR